MRIEMINKTTSFKESIRRLFIQYTFIPIVVLFLLFFAFTIFNSKQAIINDTNKAAKILSESMATVHQNYDDEINVMVASTDVINFVTTRLKSEAIYEAFYTFNSQQAVKSTFHIIDANGVFLASSETLDPNLSEPIHKDIVTRIQKDPTSVLSETNNLSYINGRKTVYTYGKAIMNDKGIIGYILFHLLESDLQNLLFIQGNEISVVTDQHDTIISTSNNSTRNRLNKFNPNYDEKGYIQTDQGPYYMKEQHVASANFYVHTLNSIQFSKDVYVYLMTFLLFTSLMLWVLINKLAHRTSLRHTESIDKLLFAVRQLQRGNTNSHVSIHTGDEFEILANQYNVMLDHLNELMKKNEETANVKRIIEIKKLQAQFNPHFIFNILETLRYAVYVDIKKAETIILKLSKLLRYSIHNDGYKVILKEDFNYIIDYLDLQQVRFNERLKYHIRISHEVSDAFVPRLLLQTIIENSIKHGFRYQENLVITIKGFVENGNLILEVGDNGRGIDSEKLEEIRNIMNEQDNLTHHIGLYNIHRQLKLLYGANYGINIESASGTGTIVSIKIPYEKDDIDV